MITGHTTAHAKRDAPEPDLNPKTPPMPVRPPEAPPINPPKRC